MLIDCDPGQAETLRTCLLSELGLRDVDYIHDNAAFEHLGHTSLPGIPSRGALTSVPQVVTVGYVPAPTFTHHAFTANVPVLESVDMFWIV